MVTLSPFCKWRKPGYRESFDLIIGGLKFFLNKTKNKHETKTYKKFITELLATANNSGTNINRKKNLYEFAFVKKKILLL